MKQHNTVSDNGICLYTRKALSELQFFLSLMLKLQENIQETMKTGGEVM